MDELTELLTLMKAGLRYCPTLLGYLGQIEAEIASLQQENDGLLQMVKEAEDRQERAERLLGMIILPMLCRETT